MSRKCCKKELVTIPVYGGGPGKKCICNFPTLVILIIIVLQFSKNKGDKDYCDKQQGKDLVGNGVLFIIALFFLSCSGCGKGAY